MSHVLREYLFIFIFLVTLAVMDVLDRREERDPIVSTLIIMILFVAAFGVYSYVTEWKKSHEISLRR